MSVLCVYLIAVACLGKPSDLMSLSLHLYCLHLEEVCQWVWTLYTFVGLSVQMC